MLAYREVFVNAKKMQLLRDFPWGENYPELVAFTEWSIQGKQWNSGSLPTGHTAESIVQEVITKTFSEERNWDPERGDLLIWLKYIIRSEISHLAESTANRVEVPLDLDGENDSLIDDKDNILYQPPPQDLHIGTPEDAVIALEAETEKTITARLKIDALLEACSGNSELEEIVYAIIEGQCAAKPQELADFLGKPIDRIYQNLRALRRRAIKIRIEVQNGKE